MLNRSAFFMLFLALLFCIVSLPAAAQDAVDWPMFKADVTRSGMTDAPVIDQPAIAWSTHVGIMGYLNCPVIDGNLVFDLFS